MLGADREGRSPVEDESSSIASRRVMGCDDSDKLREEVEWRPRYASELEKPVSLRSAYFVPASVRSFVQYAGLKGGVPPSNSADGTRVSGCSSFRVGLLSLDSIDGV